MARRNMGMGGFPGGNMNQLLQQAQKMQKDMARAQEELATMVVETSSGGGLVTCRMNGEHQLTALQINPEALNPEDADMLQDAIITAVNEASRQLAAASEEKLGQFGALAKGL
ncbi:MAG: YbaB/EbfC family nucleoid-associated protein [Oscillospiraceae bacterium]|nr:YbaB/EbfC family nucleoid-associated protein [Oscillospiraceae bacterium]MDD4368926.1 YbaB/EbfC family nucleoid-associated protein [Oscillospiraceae bacterium]